jgi:hypothetical protein
VKKLVHLVKTSITAKKANKNTASKKGARDNATTQGTLERLKTGLHLRVVSHAIITSDYKRDDNPDANQ